MEKDELITLINNNGIYGQLLKQNYHYEGMGGLYDLCSDLDNLPNNLTVLYKNKETGNSLVSIRLKSWSEKYVLLKINVLDKKISLLEEILEVPEGFLLK
jgi:hypothetical protein